MQYHKAKVWRRKGQALKIPTAGEDQKAIGFGAVEYASGHVLWQMCPRKGETAFIAFLEDLTQTLPANEPAVLVLDNVGYHKSHSSRRSGGATPTASSRSFCRPTRPTSI